MQFSTLMTSFVLVAVTVADLHYNAVCVNNSDIGDTYNADATIQACEWYKLRNKGDDWWNTCPDCVMIDTTCNSAEKHMGGDEITYYCQLAGADNALTS